MFLRWLQVDRVNFPKVSAQPWVQWGIKILPEINSLFNLGKGAGHDVVSGLNLDLVLVFLLAAMVAVPVARRLKSSPVLGYLAAGLLIGPHAFQLVGDTKTVELVAELGIVFLLFTIGLEMSFERLFALRRAVLGLGGSQLLICGGAIGAITYAITGNLVISLVVAAGLSLSSTAFALQFLQDRDQTTTRHGRAAFGMLLMQDLAVVPLLVLLPLLALGFKEIIIAIGFALGIGIVSLALIIVLGLRVFRPIYRYVAHARSPELFTATTLFLVLGMGAATHYAGLSMALGGFVAGLVLAETEYRHQIEAEIEPFRGLLLGLFFMSIGMAMDVRLLTSSFFPVIGILVGLIAVKGLAVAVICKVFRLSWSDAIRTAMLIAPGGEFAFLLFGLADNVGVIDSQHGQILMLSVALSMVLSPFLVLLGERAIHRYLDSGKPVAQEVEGAGMDHHVVIAGYGRVGQNVAQVLAAEGLPYVALDMSPQRVAHMRSKGLPVFFGDASKLEVLKAAGIARAKAVVITLDKPAQAHRTTAVLHRAYPDLPIIVRAHDTHHVARLKAVGATAVVPATVESSLQLAGIALTISGTRPEDVALLIENIRNDGYAGLDVPEEDPVADSEKI